MKTNTLYSVSFFCTSLAMAIALVMIGAMGTAKAQNTVPQLDNFDSNGLFTPTSAQRFFEQGRRNMEREIEILEDPEHYFGEGILQINTIDIKVIQETGSTKPIDNFPGGSSQYELETNHTN
ncbi:hypothetical protein [Pleurocapsa sp. PCC 7319]|uniref:hypothetical protein n=1 Tax=Pleurocapsa sp. PCC 7319 TaxID=118161 RepID=UPI00034B59F3|nr:hypothetical protein [Pleurocapsa sp. PCC 7319]